MSLRVDAGGWYGPPLDPDDVAEAMGLVDGLGAVTNLNLGGSSL